MQIQETGFRSTDANSLRIIQDFDLSFYLLAKEFTKKYYSYEGEISDFVIIWETLMFAPNIVCIAWEHYWHIEHMYEALKHNITQERLFERNDYCIAKTQLWERFENLIKFCQNRMQYTREERTRDKIKIAETNRNNLYYTQQDEH